MRIGIAFRVWWRVLTDSAFATRIADLLKGPATEAAPDQAPEPARPAKAVRPAAPARSDAIMLLAALQREARLVDLVREPLENFNDAQIGAAARDVLRDCGQVLDRMFDIGPVLDNQEGSEVDVPDGFDTGCYRLSGEIQGEPPFRGRLVHHGWKASFCKIPQWSGSEAASLVVAPAEVEVASSAEKVEGDG